MNRICKNNCFPYSDKQRCSRQLKLPQTTVQARKWNFDADRKNDPLYKFQCNCEERRRRVEAKRKKMIQKLKFEYRINVDELGNTALQDIIQQTEILEKQKKMREKGKIQRRFNFISKLVQEERIKYRVPDRKPRIGQRKKLHKITRSGASEASTIQIGESEDPDILHCLEAEETEDSEDEIQNLEEERQMSATETFESDLTKCAQKESQELLLEPEFFESPREIPVTTVEVKETYLKCTPDSIVFESCEPNKTYTQTYRITNIGFDVVHCRYAGLETENHGVLLRVEMIDSVMLRPGLSFIGRIKVCSWVDTAEVNNFLIFETRRKKSPNKKACFRIPVKCLTTRSIVEVSPKVIRFAPVTWCEATSQERSERLRKTIKIKNVGTKDCSCSIVNFENFEGSTTTSEMCVAEEESVEIIQPLHSSTEESLGEDYYIHGPREEILTILSELLANVFETFRFSRKYHVPVPAKSVVEVDVDFLPEYRGYHHKLAFIRFEGADNCTGEKLEMIGDIKKVPLRVEPPTIDLKICIINSGVYEGTFRVYNDSNSPFPIRLSVPGSMKEHSLVFPRHPVIQPWSYQTCSVRLFPRLSIPNDAFRYYKEDTKVLEFPVFIQPIGQNACKSDRIKLYVFAILTDATLELQPHEINFGVVTTLETVRTEISLINHSMCVQEFGFLHLPMGVRIEPNYGFGIILPKETIRLYLLYSPVLNCTNNQTKEGSYNFHVEVTSIEKLCRFNEHIHAPPEAEPTDTILGEELTYNTEADQTPQEILSSNSSQINEDEEETEEAEEEELLTDNEELKVLQNKQQKIRDYLKQKTDLFYGASITENMRADEKDFRGETICEEISTRSSLSDNKHIVTCKSVVIKPFCELSTTVIQMPATPLSSASVSRFRINTNHSEKCKCKLMGQAPKKYEEPLFEAFFEFHSPSTLIKIEPQTGHIFRGQSVPVAIIFRPEFSKDELIYQSRILKAELLFEETNFKNDNSPPLNSKSKTKTTKPVRQASRNHKPGIESQDVNLSRIEINQYDLFSGEKALQQTIDPFHLEFKVICVMKIFPCQDISERIEYHNFILIAPVVKPSCIFLGKCQEITFGKIAVGCRSRKIIEIQNLTLNRISPKITALNPHGPFTCTTGSKTDKVDPEHIWRHPITFSPTEETGKVTEFFEVRHGATCIPLTATGEGIMPEYAFSPDFALCVLKTPANVIAEVEVSINNLCGAELRFQFVMDFVKEASNYRYDSAIFETNGSRKSDTAFKKPEKKGNQTTKDGKMRTVFKNELISEVASQLENEFVNVSNPTRELFAITGLDKNNEAVLNPFGKCLLKIKFFPTKDNVSSKKGETSPSAAAYAVGYKVMLARKLLKNLTIIGAIHSDT